MVKVEEEQVGVAYITPRDVGGAGMTSVLKILDEGEVVEGAFGKRLRLFVELPNGEKKYFSINKLNKNKLIALLGPDTKLWVRKSFHVISEPCDVGDLKLMLSVKS